MGSQFRRPALYSSLALAALVAGHQVGGLQVHTTRDRLVVCCCAVGVAVFGVAASRSAGNRIGRAVAGRAGVSPGASLRIATLLLGYLITLAAVLDLLALPVHYFVGGTVVAVVLGVAAQQLLGNLFAGLVLLFARPYKPGEYIRIRSGALGGPHEGRVELLGLLYTTISSADGPINVPNSALLAAAVGPVPEPAGQTTDESEVGSAAADPQAAADSPDGPRTLELPRLR